jgi:tetratricopeptide (TPR) repeat protein
MRNLLVSCLLLGCAMSCNVAAAEGEPSPQMEACFDMADLAIAITACTALIDAETSTPKERLDARYYRAEAHSRSGNQAAARADIDAVVEAEPENVGALTTRGIISGAEGKFHLALDDFHHALRLDPQDVYAHINIGNVYGKLGNQVEAVAAYDRANTLDPEQPASLAGACWARAVLNRELTRAATECDRALELVPDDGNAYNSRGFVRFRQGQHADAIADYDYSLELAAEVASSYYIRGLAKRALGNASGDEDVARALALDAAIVERYVEFGVAQ